MFNLRKSSSKLYDQNIFDDQFMRDLTKKPEKALLLKVRFSELPELKNSSRYFIGSKNVAWQYYLTPNRLKNTIEIYKLQVRKSLSLLQSAGIEVLFTVKHHRKLAIIDREIIYEDSLNIFFVSRQL